MRKIKQIVVNNIIKVLNKLLHEFKIKIKEFY